MATAAKKIPVNHQVGHMFMATILWLIGGLPPAEQRPFVQGLCRVLQKWLTNDADRGETRWPPSPYKAEQQPAARRKGRK